MKNINAGNFIFRAACIGALLSVIWIGSPAQAVVISDTEFVTTDWAEQIVFNAQPVLPVFSVGRSATGGNPDAYRTIQHVYTGPGSMAVGHRFTKTSYDPSTQGAIATVDYNLDTLFVSQMGLSLPGAVGFSSAIFQNNSWYSTTLGTILPPFGVWNSFSNIGVAASDFNLLLGSGPAQPDFSGTGAVIQFGFMSSNGSASGGQNTVTSGADNFSVTINPATIAEPGTLALFGLGLLGLGVTRRRKVAKAA